MNDEPRWQYEMSSELVEVRLLCMEATEYLRDPMWARSFQAQTIILSRQPISIDMVRIGLEYRSPRRD